MKGTQKPNQVALGSLIAHLKEGRYVIPKFQRDFEWSPWDIQELARSIFLDYYIGSLLLWKGKTENFHALACEPIHGFKGEEQRDYIVLDGQQRLTAMFYMFTAPNVPPPSRSNRFFYFVRVDRFVEESYDEAFYYDWKVSARKLAENKKAQFDSNVFPLSVMGQGPFELAFWIRDYESHWQVRLAHAKQAGDEQAAQDAQRHADNSKVFGRRLEELTREYKIASIELDQELELEKVCDIFTQINSRGVKLDVFDLINALLTPKGLELKHMWRKAKPRLEFLTGGKGDVYVLQVMSILKQAYCSPRYLFYLLPGQVKSVREPDRSLRKEVLVANAPEFEALWDNSVTAIEQAIGQLRDPHSFGVISAGYMPYLAMLPVFAALQVEAAKVPPARRLDAQRKFRKWYWSSIFNSRYSGSVESTATSDYLAVCRWFADNAAEPALIRDFAESFRSLDFRKEVKRGSSVYNGVFNLFVLRGARDWISGKVPPPDELDDHHIVPRDWRKHHPEVEPLIDSILNRAPLTADTNRNLIRNRLPNEYLPEQLKDPEARAILESHLISPRAVDILLRKPFTKADFIDFLTEREGSIKEAIESLLIKERIQLAPALRELDERLEKVELKLRAWIHSRLGEDWTQAPPHVREKVEERVEGALKKNPALDRSRFKQVAVRLEFCDLRELQEIVLNKSLWSLFEDRLINRESVALKFGQLADLRNGIRHSRSVDEIVRKEGEAALLWFEALVPSIKPLPPETALEPDDHAEAEDNGESASEEPGERDELRHDFWSDFVAQLRKDGDELHGSRTPLDGPYLSAQRNGLQWTYAIKERSNSVRLLVQWKHGASHELFANLIDNRVAIERSFGDLMTVDAGEGASRGLIGFKLSGGYRDPRVTWPHTQRHMASAMQRLVRAVAPYLGEATTPLTGHGTNAWTSEDFAMWVSIRKANGIDEDPTDSDIWHSDLLDRIARGGPVFEMPPPTKYSYPWVRLCEQGFDVAGTEGDDGPLEVTIDSEAANSESGPAELSFQQSSWVIEGRFTANGRQGWGVRHRNGWNATVSWEEGPFVLGTGMLPNPHDIVGPAYIVRLADPPGPARLLPLKGK